MTQPVTPRMAELAAQEVRLVLDTFDHDIAAAGGSVPIRIHGVGVVAAVTVSGLLSDDDHDFVVAALDAYVQGQV